MEEEFGALYRQLIGYLEPRQSRLREGMEGLLAQLEGSPPPGAPQPPLQSEEQCGIENSDRESKSRKKAGNEA